MRTLAPLVAVLLAAAAGLPDYHSVYDHGDNADLKARRPNANALLVGDVVAVPEVETKTVDAATTRRHRYVVDVRAVKLRVKVLDREGRPLSGKAWRLTWGGGQRDGTLGSDGKIEAELPAPVALTDPECRADPECAPIACCGPTSADGCVARASAPRECGSVECPAPRGPVLRCACRAGRCVGIR